MSQRSPVLSRRDVLRAGSAAAALAALPGGIRRVAASPAIRPSAQGSTITFWSRDSGEVLVQPLVDAWNASHDNQIEPTFIPSDQFIQKFAAAVAGGEAPDLVAVDLIYMPAFAEAGQMTDITEQAQALPFFQQLSPPH